MYERRDIRKTGINHLRKLTLLITQVDTVAGLLKESFACFKESFLPAALGVFIWTDQDSIHYQQENLDHLIKSIDTSWIPEPHGVLPTRTPWINPVHCLMNLHRALERRQKFLRCLPLQGFQRSHGILVIELKTRNEFADLALNVSATLMGLTSSLLAYVENSKEDTTANTINDVAANFRVISRALNLPLEIIDNYLLVLDRETNNVDPHKKYIDIMREKLRIIQETIQTVGDGVQQTT
ncbi:MAG: hypothetical protein ABH878_09265 [bacterium]